jgi:sphingolipid delta-4 desaturase
MGFTLFHLKHHSYQGSYDHDADVSSEWEARLVGNRWYMKALWLLLFPLFQLTRPMRMDSTGLVSPWSVASAVTALTFAIAMTWLFGWMSLAYLLASMFFSVGLHPLGARWIQEHYTTDPSQETFSYYGPLNLLALNVGYHNEHHDFPSIPWNRLPQLRRMAPDYYDTLRSHRSWSKLLAQFIFNPSYCLHSRVLRAPSS